MKVEWRELAIYKGFKIMCQFVDGYAIEAVCERFPALKEEDEEYGLACDISEFQYTKDSDVIRNASKAIDAFWEQYDNIIKQ